MASVSLCACASSGPNSAGAHAPLGGGIVVKPNLPPLKIAPRKISPATGSIGSESKMSNPAIPLTAAGENSEPRFSNDGKKLLFVSRNRINHTQAQIYELDLDKMIERRITYHNGEDEAPTWFGPEQIIYASSTDEVKQIDVTAERLMKTYYPEGMSAAAKGQINTDQPLREIYLQTIDGRKMDRLTEDKGFNSEPDVDPKLQNVVLTSTRGGHAQLYILEKRRARRLTEGDSKDVNPRYSPDGQQVIFVRQTGTDAAANLFLLEGKGLHSVIQLTSSMDVADPVWTPDGKWVVFASKNGAAIHGLYAYDLQKRCVGPLTEAAADLRNPTLSPDGKRLAFSAQLGATKHIYISDFALPAICTPESTPSPVTTPSPSPSAKW